LNNTEYIAISAVGATLLSILITWLIMKRQFASKKLSYSYSIEPIVKNSDPDLARDIKVLYQGEELPDPTLMSLEICNTGYTAIENAEVSVELPDSTYLIPGHFVDIPAGYSSLWDIERTDAEECTIFFKHINPGQKASILLLMDGSPTGLPRISCPMPNVEFNQANLVKLGIISELVVQIVAPQLISLRRVR